MQARSRATYDSILDAAARLLARSGYAALTTNHVAKAAGVAIGSLYEYFDTKEAIVAEVVRRTVNEVVSDISRSFGLALAEGFDSGLKRLVRAMYAAVESRSRLMRVLWMDVPFLWELEEVQRVPELLLAVAKSGIPGATSPWLIADPEAATYLLTVMVGAAVVESVVARPEQLSAEQVERSLVALLTQLLGPPESACATGKAVVLPGAR